MTPRWIPSRPVRLRLSVLLALALVSLPLPFLGFAQANALTLEEAIALALRNNERSQSADARVQAADARVARARAFFFPSATASASYTRRGRESVAQSQNALSATLSLGLTVFDPRSIPLYRQATLDREATELESLDEKQRLAFEVAGAFLATLSQEQVVAAAQNRLELSQQTAGDARGRVAAQLTSSNDLTRAELALVAAERELTRAQADLATAYVQLGFLIGAEVQGPLTPPASPAAAPPSAGDASTTLATQARGKRPDLVAARRRAEAVHASADEAAARVWPSLDLLGQFRAGNEEGISGENTDWSISLTLTWVLYDGGARYAERRERLANAQVANLSAQAAERRLESDVRAALIAIDRAQKAVAQSEAAVAVAVKNGTESTVLYREGLIRAIEVADAANQRFDAEVALARERFGLAIALLDLRAALGQDPLGKQ